LVQLFYMGKGKGFPPSPRVVFFSGYYVSHPYEKGKRERGRRNVPWTQREGKKKRNLATEKREQKITFLRGRGGKVLFASQRKRTGESSAFSKRERKKKPSHKKRWG